MGWRDKTITVYTEVIDANDTPGYRLLGKFSVNSLDNDPLALENVVFGHKPACFRVIVKIGAPDKPELTVTCYLLTRMPNTPEADFITRLLMAVKVYNPKTPSVLIVALSMGDILSMGDMLGPAALCQVYYTAKCHCIWIKSNVQEALDSLQFFGYFNPE